ncbi:hypothetical protein HRD57_08870 [Tetragenococcus halophilus]|nr:hypothetical protein [Tetragenococcus halophilus]
MKMTTRKKFWIVVMLCTVVTLGGMIAYGIYLNPEDNQQTSSSREPFNLNKQDPQAPKREKKESRKKKSMKDVLDKALPSLESSQNERSTNDPLYATPHVLIHQLATAWDKQYTKEDQRRKETIQKNDRSSKKAKRRIQVPLLENHRRSHKQSASKHINVQLESNVEKFQPKKGSFNKTDKNKKGTNFLNTTDAVVRKSSKKKDQSSIKNYQKKSSDDKNVM